jgi:hypothetical protein
MGSAWGLGLTMCLCGLRHVCDQAPLAPRGNQAPGGQASTLPASSAFVLLQPIALLTAVGQLYADGSGAQGSMVCYPGSLSTVMQGVSVTHPHDW